MLSLFSHNDCNERGIDDQVRIHRARICRATITRANLKFEISTGRVVKRIRERAGMVSTVTSRAR